MTIGKKVKNAFKGEFVFARPASKLTQGLMLKILRKKHGFSQKELAEQTGLAQSTISGLENGRLNIEIERAKILAGVLKVHPGVLAFPDWTEKSVA